jgi:hypothetical protein
LKDILDAVVSILEKLGWVNGTFVVFFFGAHYVLYRMYLGRLKDRQGQIDALAAENRDYRERFMAFLDKHHDFRLPPPGPDDGPEE